MHRSDILLLLPLLDTPRVQLTINKLGQLIHLCGGLWSCSLGKITLGCYFCFLFLLSHPWSSWFSLNFTEEQRHESQASQTSFVSGWPPKWHLDQQGFLMARSPSCAASWTRQSMWSRPAWSRLLHALWFQQQDENRSGWIWYPYQGRIWRQVLRTIDVLAAQNPKSSASDPAL